MKVYYIKNNGIDDRCIDIGKRILDISKSSSRYIPLVGVAFGIAKTIAYGYGSCKFLEYMGVYHEGATDYTFSSIYGFGKGAIHAINIFK